MKLKELLKGRDKLRKYDELKQWKDLFEQSNPKISQSQYSVSSMGISCGTSSFELPDNIRKIFADALEAEIKKLDEE